MSIFGKHGEFIGMPQAGIDLLAPAERAAYDNVASAAAACETAEQLCVATERKLVEQTTEIRALTDKLARYPKPSRIDEVRRVLMHDGG